MSDKTQKTIIKFNPPLAIGDKEIDSVALREFTAGELIGLDISELAKLSVNEIARLTPRISTPALSAEIIYGLSAQNYLKLASGVAGFFGPGPDSQEPESQGRLPASA